MGSYSVTYRVSDANEECGGGGGEGGERRGHNGAGDHAEWRQHGDA